MHNALGNHFLDAINIPGGIHLAVRLLAVAYRAQSHHQRALQGWLKPKLDVSVFCSFFLRPRPFAVDRQIQIISDLNEVVIKRKTGKEEKQEKHTFGHLLLEGVKIEQRRQEYTLCSGTSA